MPMSKATIVVVVKYFPPFPRISGILTFVSLLVSELGRTHDVHVVTAALSEPVPESVERCTVHRVGWPFPVTSALATRGIAADVVVTVSGIYDLRLATAYFLPGRLAVRRSVDTYLYQATWPEQPPGRVFRAMARSYTGLLTASAGIRDRFARRGLASETVAPAVDVARLAAIAPRSGRPLRVGFVNHLNRVKGADLASEAIARLRRESPSLEFVIAGVGELEAEIRERHRGDDRVRVLGFLPEAERLEVLASCDVMLLPFRQATSVLGVSQTALEVLALGNIVVGTATGSLQEAIEDDRNGLLVDPAGDVESSMVEAVLSLEQTPDRVARLRSAAAADAAQRWDIVVRATEVSERLVDRVGR